NKKINRPFEIFKSRTSVIIATVLTSVTVGFANIFTIIEPAFSKDIASTLWMIAGPLFFTVVALLMFRRYEKSKNVVYAKNELKN
ncbi:MAG TPA: glutamate/gamma-aminobutyrate family transporter YjeM, partial [Thermoanaerobacterium sp.]|nr:glutamate/gamma-aminobutyrate family transporter YjeM [Thermoanaerobacterium sp.]